MNQEFLDAIKESVQISHQNWVKWQHEMMGIIHCGSCLVLPCTIAGLYLATNPLHRYTRNAIARQ